MLKVKVDRKNSEIINRLEKTQLELSPDFKAEQDTYLAHVRAAKRVEEKVRRAEEKAAKEEDKRMKELREYKHIMKVWLQDCYVTSKIYSVDQGFQMSD